MTILLLVSSQMTPSIHWWLRLLLWLVTGLSGLSTIIIVAKENMKSGVSFGNGLRRAFLVITGAGVTQRANKRLVLYQYPDKREMSKCNTDAMVRVEQGQDTLLDYTRR